MAALNEGLHPRLIGEVAFIDKIEIDGPNTD
jgi:hypothetical protein